MGCHLTAVHKLNTLFFFKIEDCGGRGIVLYGDKHGTREMVIGWEIYIAFVADSLLSLSV